MWSAAGCIGGCRLDFHSRRVDEECPLWLCAHVLRPDWAWHRFGLEDPELEGPNSHLYPRPCVCLDRWPKNAENKAAVVPSFINTLVCTRFPPLELPTRPSRSVRTPLQTVHADTMQASKRSPCPCPRPCRQPPTCATRPSTIDDQPSQSAKKQKDKATFSTRTGR